MKNIVILGSSGSIGISALKIASLFPEELRVYGISVHSNIDVLQSQVRTFKPEFVCISDNDSAGRFKPDFENKNLKVLSGSKSLEELASHPDVDIVINSVVGFAGLKSTIAAVQAGKRIALANKESMVVGGELINRLVELHGAEIIPVDSEHSAIFQCLEKNQKNEVRKLILTSSGGPFRELDKSKFKEISVKQALNHPTWAMGNKITIDSATLMNKGLEIIEACYLFGMPHDKIDVVIHPQSVIHSMVEYIDGSIISQMSRPDMCLPIQYALFYPERRNQNIADLDFQTPKTMNFYPPDNDKFPSLGFAREALNIGKTAPAVFNAANEVAVDMFLKGKIKFTEIFDAVEFAIKSSDFFEADSVEAIIEADINSRENSIAFLKRKSQN